jgi:hypothetical protein
VKFSDQAFHPFIFYTAYGGLHMLASLTNDMGAAPFRWGMVIPTLFPLLRRMEAPDMCLI